MTGSDGPIKSMFHLQFVGVERQQPPPLGAINSFAAFPTWPDVSLPDSRLAPRHARPPEGLTPFPGLFAQLKFVETARLA
jgi:hypothetical protein